MADRYYLPQRTEGLVKRQIGQCKNLALILDKYPEREVIEDTKQKGEWLKRLIEEVHVDKQLAKAVYGRWSLMTGRLQATRFRGALSWRMVTGLGGGNALESDLTLHHHYGVPFIPGSALKGLTRAYVAGEDKKYFISVKDEKEKKAARSEEEDHQDLKRIFGSQESAGTVSFYDAVPYDGECAFAVDIMNPHYPDYYKALKSEKKTAPSNDQAPIPVVFLTVASMNFAFAVAPRDAQNGQHREDAALVTDWLQGALAGYGVGGKTSAGYGIFLKDQFRPIGDAPVVEQALARQPASSARSVSHKLTIPTLREGQDVQGVVIDPTAQMKSAYPQALLYLRYQEYPRDQLFIVIEGEAQEVQNWKVNESRFGLYQRREERNGCTVFVCKPRLPKEKKAKKK